MTDYTEYKYLWPPRPEKKVMKSMINFLAKQGFGAQKKKNGTCCLIFANQDQVIFKTRHPNIEDANHTAWSPLPAHTAFFKSVSQNGWNVFVGELLHSKTPHIKNHIFIFDQLVKDGKTLYGTEFLARQNMIAEEFAHLRSQEEDDLYRLNEYVSIAKVFRENFLDIYNHLKPEDEGLVFKKLNAKLEPCIRSNSNEGWQVKCRIPTKLASF